jgi:hypothetical protein
MARRASPCDHSGTKARSERLVQGVPQPAVQEEGAGVACGTQPTARTRVGAGSLAAARLASPAHLGIDRLGKRKIDCPVRAAGTCRRATGIEFPVRKRELMVRFAIVA